MAEEVQEWLSTGQAAKCCSVRPDTILKWIKRGKLRAERTPGGHYRIQRRELEPLILTPRPSAEARVPESHAAHPLRCWEYLGAGSRTREECLECIVYRSRAAWCFQMVEMAREVGHSRRFCVESCEDCTYYQRVLGLETGVLILTRDRDLAGRLTTESVEGIRFAFASDGYEASSIVQEFRPAFVVVDEDLLRGPDSGLLGRLEEDPRLPGVRLILAVSRGRGARVPESMKRESLVGVIEKPFAPAQIASVVEAFPVETKGLGGANA